MIASNKANLGRALELAVIASQGNVVRLWKIEHGRKFLRGGDTVGLRTPFDFFGVVVGAGRSIMFDCKATDDAKCPVGSHKFLKPHQREHLILAGQNGSIAGLLIESTAKGRFYWMSWPELAVRGMTSITWELLADLGPTTHRVPFERIPEIAKHLTTEGISE